MRSQKLVIFGHYGLPNWGDEAILTGMLQLLDQEKWRITIVSPFRSFIEKHYSLPSIFPPPSGLRSFLTYGREMQKTYTALREADFVLFGGGGLFQENPKKALRIWNSYLRICLALGKKVLLVGNSVGPFLTARSLQKTAHFFQKTSFVSVRDEASYQRLKKMAIAENKSVLATDFACALKPRDREWKKRKGILLALRPDDLSPALQKMLIPFCQKQIEPILFLSMQSKQAYDEKIVQQLGIPVFQPTSLESLRRKISSAKLVIANRLHAGILAMLSETPFLMIPSRPKISDFFCTLGLENLILPPKLSFKKLERKQQEILNKHAVLQKKLRKIAMQEQKKTALLLPDFLL